MGFSIRSLCKVWLPDKTKKMKGSVLYNTNLLIGMKDLKTWQNGLGYIPTQALGIVAWHLLT